MAYRKLGTTSSRLTIPTILMSFLWNSRLMTLASSIASNPSELLAFKLIIPYLLELIILQRQSN
jgi:hypothetical protein